MILNRTIKIEVKQSLYKHIFVVLPHLIVTVILLIALAKQDLSKVYYLLVLIFILLSITYYVRRYLSLSSKSGIHSVFKNSDDSWKITLKDDEVLNVSLLSASFVSNILIILNFKDSLGNKHYSTLFCIDSVSPNEFRKLKVFIRTHNWDT